MATAPAFETGSVSVIIPTLNEAESIGAVVASIPDDVVGRIIVADGGSSDDTPVLARKAGAEVLNGRRGYGGACRAGAEHASDTDILVFMDGDGADDPDAILKLVGPIRAQQFDFVIGSRVRGTREPGSMAWHQVLAGRMAGWLTGVLYGVRYTDMCALRAIRRDALMSLGMCELTYGWNLEMQMRAARAGLRILEVPVRYRRRLGGESKVAGSLSGTLRAGTRIVLTFIRVATEARRVPALQPRDT